jgi:hypothetical protein
VRPICVEEIAKTRKREAGRKEILLLIFFAFRFAISRSPFLSVDRTSALSDTLAGHPKAEAAPASLCYTRAAAR